MKIPPIYEFTLCIHFHAQLRHGPTCQILKKELIDFHLMKNCPYLISPLPQHKQPLSTSPLRHPVLRPTPFLGESPSFSLLSVIQRGGKTHTALAAVIRSKRVSEMCGWERKLKGGRDGAVRVIYLEGVSLLVRWLGYSGKKFVQQGSQSMDE